MLVHVFYINVPTAVQVYWRKFN